MSKIITQRDLVTANIRNESAEAIYVTVYTLHAYDGWGNHVYAPAAIRIEPGETKVGLVPVNQ